MKIFIALLLVRKRESIGRYWPLTICHEKIGSKLNPLPFRGRKIMMLINIKNAHAACHCFHRTLSKRPKMTPLLLTMTLNKKSHEGERISRFKLSDCKIFKIFPTGLWMRTEELSCCDNLTAIIRIRNFSHSFICFCFSILRQTMAQNPPSSSSTPVVILRR